MSMRLVQLLRGTQRAVAVVEEPNLRLLARYTSIYDLALDAIANAGALTQTAMQFLTDELLEYDRVYQDKDDWKLFTAIDHPHDPARCLVSGTGLTHLGSARDRQAMHIDGDESQLSDSMRMFRWGMERGKPPAGEVGVPPEWFYKGNGTILRSPGQPLEIPWFSTDGGEEAEIAGVYIIGPDEQPFRIGMTIGNEFSDHVFEKENYLNLAGSKLRTCSIGPELVINPPFQKVKGNVTITRGDKEIWRQDIATGEREMCHSLANIEHHHFKFPAHRRPGDVHIHYYGAHSLSFGQGIKLADGDWMQIMFDGFGRPLRNRLRREPRRDEPVVVHPLL